MTIPPWHGYDACGLSIRSELELPGLSPARHASADLVVRRGDVAAPAEWPVSGVAAWPSPEADVLSWVTGVRLRVADSEIVVDGGPEAFARQCIVGPGLGVALHRRGRLVLHGSAVDVGGRALVLLGHKGAGKSTTAAALLGRGHTLLTDDLVVVVPDEAGQPACSPGPTQMKLWPASAEALGLAGDVHPFAEGMAKGVWFGAPMATQPVLIAALCTLGWKPATQLSALSGAEAFGGLFEHIYAPRFLGAGAGRALVGIAARLCTAVPVLRLVRPERLEALPEVVRRLEALAEGRP